MTSKINDKNGNLNNIFVVLDNVRSAQNVGSFFRTCDSLNVEKIYLCGITSVPPNKEIFKTALGATESVKWEYFESTFNCIKHLKDNEINNIICVEQTKKSVLLNKFDFNFNKNICLVFGNEIEGVSNEILELADHCVEIPQLGTKHSLNVSVAAGIVIWEVLSKKLRS